MRSKIQNSDSKLFCVAPFCTMKKVLDIASAVQNGTLDTATRRIDLDAIGLAHNLKVIQYQQDIDALPYN